MKGDELRGHLEGLVLAALADGPAHGYSVIARIRERSRDQLDLAEGTIYPALHRLEADGHLTAAWTNVNGRRRKIYTLTRPGHRELAAQRLRWHEFSTLITHALGARA